MCHLCFIMPTRSSGRLSTRCQNCGKKCDSQKGLRSHQKQTKCHQTRPHRPAWRRPSPVVTERTQMSSLNVYENQPGQIHLEQLSFWEYSPRQTIMCNATISRRLSLPPPSLQVRPPPPVPRTLQHQPRIIPNIVTNDVVSPLKMYRSPSKEHILRTAHKADMFLRSAELLKRCLRNYGEKRWQLDSRCGSHSRRRKNGSWHDFS